MNIAVLGCGPAGLLTAHAAAIALGPDPDAAGHTLNIISKKRKSQMYGAQYLHAPIPLITGVEPEANVEVKLLGTAEGYRWRVYGNGWSGKVSPDDLLGSHPAWNLRIAYDRLWSMYGNSVINHDVHPEIVRKISSRYDLVLSTVPAPVLCEIPEEHEFLGQEIWAAGDAPEQGIFVPYACEPDTIVCNGDEVGQAAAWYRMASIFGQKTVEWPGWMAKPPVESVTTVTKPLRHSCTCSPEIVRLGRYGAWQKGVLVHEVFETALQIVLEHVTSQE